LGEVAVETLGSSTVSLTAQTAASVADAAVFRRVIGSFMSGVVVITTSHDGNRHGATVSAVSSLSLDPPMLLVCLHAASATQDAVNRSGTFAVNILAEDQGQLAERFARPGSTDKFDGVAVRTGHTGVPVFEGALAVVECRVVEAVTGGTHRVFLGSVVHAEATEGSPLAYFRGNFGKLEIAQDAEAYLRLRRLVLRRALGPNTMLDVDALAAQIKASPSSVYYALTRLVGDNLVARDPSHGHVVRPLNAETSDDAHSAKLAIELGAADLTVGKLGPAQLAEFERLASSTGTHVADGHFTDVDSYIGANSAFHTYPIRATGITALLDAYEHLSLPDLMARALSKDIDVSDHLVADHLGLVDAYQREDLLAAKRVIIAHNERAKATQRAGIERAGGQL
jgi:flavin reductase (DIM6/NTAB) family NADH-FMN oxidoreductase RutF/DNA-binding GntR family transcriptional regulator